MSLFRVVRVSKRHNGWPRRPRSQAGCDSSPRLQAAPCARNGAFSLLRHDSAFRARPQNPQRSSVVIVAADLGLDLVKDGMAHRLEGRKLRLGDEAIEDVNVEACFARRRLDYGVSVEFWRVGPVRRRRPFVVVLLFDVALVFSVADVELVGDEGRHVALALLVRVAVGDIPVQLLHG
ncbi:hypothetical protein FA09DRAFT_214408 [Tilletiopsis washingtonensis]|uniref:Uncharacterized protein n=1 Tax=Tilletiopsis washingtonensis TaxID=58919 RepID=A0A316ZHA3_9BASI|nr:hypothetical protein FA09DRAFT_214408 [Tilletiopsis washingtonensis]PWN99655.1 hypothetical protein FA09DRAFT_214408 [Tilletiopsis washingtonensis]